MKCRYCNRTMPKTMEKRIHHFTRNHPDVVLGMGMRIASNPRAFGEALGRFMQTAVSNGKLQTMIEREGIF